MDTRIQYEGRAACRMGLGPCGRIHTAHIATVIVILTIVSTAGAKYSGGSGTAGRPYQIATAADLITLGETPEDYDKHFILTADIDLDPNLPGRKVFDKAVIAPDVNDMNTRLDGSTFTGVFDGNGHTILHLTIRGKGTLGLFGQLGWWGPVGDVRNLGVVDVKITGSRGGIGGLVGYNNYGTVVNCYSTGQVSGGSGVGGLVGSNHGNITNCYSVGTVEGNNYVGGLVGSSGGHGTVTHCYSICAVHGGREVGGLVGCTLEGGGVTQCYSSGTVSGESSIGGLVGHNGCPVTGCYSVGTVDGNNYVGGLVGVGGPGRVTASFWDTQTSGQTESAGGMGKTTAEMQTVSTFLETGWDFAGETANGTEDIWWIDEGKSYPRLMCELFSRSSPDPGDGALDVIRTPTLCWWGGLHGYQHDVYFGEDKEAVAQATPETPGLYRGRQPAGITTYDPGTLQWNKTYYWRVDEVGAPPDSAVSKSDVWSFRVAGFIASHDPVDRATDVNPSHVLAWTPAEPGLQYDLYLGETVDGVSNATIANQGIYRGRQPADVATYAPEGLRWGTAYYWRIDGVDVADSRVTLWKGPVWSFSTADFVAIRVVDDFESYTDHRPCLIFKTWIGSGGGWVGNTDPGQGPPFAEQWIVHGGQQSMPMEYYNEADPWYSEAERTWETPQDWTIDGADTLTLYFRGQVDNAQEPLYVAIEDGAGHIAVTIHPDPRAVLATKWQKWHVPLADLRAMGVDPALLKKLVIGVGDRNNPKPGGIGKIYIDDVRLTKRMP